MSSPLEQSMAAASLETSKSERRKKRLERKNAKEKSKVTRLYRLPKALLAHVCEFLTFEEMFVCTRVCKKMARRVNRSLTSSKHCTTVEKADIKLLLDPDSFSDGVRFYRIKDDSEGSHGKFRELTLSPLRTIPKKEIRQQRALKSSNNAVQHDDAGQLAFHLKQLEFMVIYNTVNGNEIVRVANNWIFFNRELFVKIPEESLEGIADGADLPNEEKEEELFLVDITLVEANLHRKPKTNMFGWTGQTLVEPFCEITLGNLHARTSVASNEIDPVWNEDCSFTVGTKTTNTLQITLFDQGKLGRHTKLGTVEISLKNLACDVLHDVWQPIQAIAGEETFSGKFHILIHKSMLPKKDEIDTRGIGILAHCGPVCESVPLRMEIGDIILISNSEFYTHIAKLGTMSVWDHIAMVVEQEGELHLFESTPDGVFTSPLNRRLRFYLKGSTLGVRRLTLSRTNEMKQILSDFIKEVDGRPYKQKWTDLVRAWQGSHKSEDLSSIFCSELVAAAYKRMGLLDNSIPSNNFLPVDFALPNNPKVKLQHGRLEKIRMIYQTN